MITAIILARCSSSRLSKKHFHNIGQTKLIDIIINNLKKNKLISKIYLATGTKKKNLLFKNIINKNKNCEIYFHKNEDNVTERIYFLSKKIKTKHTILISGDCCLVDNDFIQRVYNQIKYTDYDFLKTKKKLIHEGITLFKTEIWKKVFKHSKKNYQKEHPGYVVKEYPKLFKIGNFKPLKYETKKLFRLSVDTESDLDFFNSHHEYLKKKNKNFNLKNVINSKNFNYLNEHVNQKKAIEINKKFIIVTAVSKEIGLGHYSRSKTIFREINETISSDIKIFCIGKKFYDKNFIYNERIEFIKKLNNSLFAKYDKIIIDLPKKIFVTIPPKLINQKNIIIIDNLYDFKKPKFIIPSIRKNINKNVYSGKNFLIIPRKTLLLRSFVKQSKNDYLLSSGSGKLNDQIINFLKKNKDIKLIMGSLISNTEINLLKRLNIKFLINPLDHLKILKSANNIYCRFGVSTYELIAIGKKPIIFNQNEKSERLKDIMYLFNKGLIKLIQNKKIISKKKY